MHTPPRPEILLGQEHAADTEHSRGRESLEGSIGRRRAINWLSETSPSRRPGGRRRERLGGSVERRWTTESPQLED